MRFFRPNRMPADAGTANDQEPPKPGPAIVSGETKTMPEGQRMDDARSPSRSSEGVRILLATIDRLTARLQACEQTIEQLELQASTQAELQAAELKEAEERLRRQIERQIADHAAATERRQKEFVSKQAKFMELLASELAKVRSMAEANAGTGDTGTPEFRPGRSAQARRPGGETAASAELDFLDLGGEPAGSPAAASAQAQDRPLENREVEFWDWLDALPDEPGGKQAPPDISFDDLAKGRPR